MCPWQDYGFCSSRGREGVSGGRGTAGRGQRHYSGETSPSAGGPLGGWGERGDLGLGVVAEGPGLPGWPVLQALKSEQPGFES